MGFALAAFTIGTALQVLGQYQAGQTQQKIHEYNAALQERNARIAQDQAQFEARRQETRTRNVLANQRAAFAHSGFTATEGTPLAILTQTVQEGEMDRLAILYGGDLQESESKARAGLSRYEGAQAKKAGTISALATGASSYGTGKALKLF